MNFLYLPCRPLLIFKNLLHLICQVATLNWMSISRYDHYHLLIIISLGYIYWFFFHPLQRCRFTTLKYIDFSDCKNITKLPNLSVIAQNIKKLELNRCENFELRFIKLLDFLKSLNFGVSKHVKILKLFQETSKMLNNLEVSLNYC